MKCSYGCGGVAKHQLKNGKWCCKKSPNQCKIIRKKNSLSVLGIPNKNLKHPENERVIKCQYCDKKYGKAGIKTHEEHCYLNPNNKRLCPICKSPIKKYKVNKTCSSRCGALLTNITISEGKTKVNYRAVCFNAHKRKCLVCDEDIFVIAHHLDGIRTNNAPENLIPLCHTHHHYIHHREYNYILKECIDEYLDEFNNKIKNNDKIKS